VLLSAFYEEFEAHLNWQVAGRPQKTEAGKNSISIENAILSSGPNEPVRMAHQAVQETKKAGFYIFIVLLTHLRTHGE